MVDKDALCPINVMSYKLNQLNIDPTNVLNSEKMIFFLFSKWTNLGPIFIDVIFCAPNVANLGFLRIVPTVAL